VTGGSGEAFKQPPIFPVVVWPVIVPPEVRDSRWAEGIPEEQEEGPGFQDEERDAGAAFEYRGRKFGPAVKAAGIEGRGSDGIICVGFPK